MGVGSDRALQEAVEEQPAVAGAAAVEAERELVEVVVQVGVADAALVGAKHPALEKRRDQVHVRQNHVCRIAARRHACFDVLEAWTFAIFRRRPLAR